MSLHFRPCARGVEKQHEITDAECLTHECVFGEVRFFSEQKLEEYVCTWWMAHPSTHDRVYGQPFRQPEWLKNFWRCSGQVRVDWQSRSFSFNPVIVNPVLDHINVADVFTWDELEAHAKRLLAAK